MTRFYLDSNATTPLHPKVREALEPFLSGATGNPSSIHAEGRRARAAVDLARDAIAHWLQAKPSEIIFTGGGTESNNLALLGLARSQISRGKHLITSAGEHHAVLHPLQYLAQHEGFELTILPLESDGRVNPDRLQKALRPETTLVSLMSANNETGVCQPMSEFGAICALNKTLFHTDAIQSAGKEPLLLKSWNVSALSLTAHKFYGPPGVGVLWLKSGIPLTPQTFGGSQENQRRPGTENVAAIAGLAKVIEVITPLQATESARLFPMIETLWQGLQDLPGIRRNGNSEHRLANTLNVSFEGLSGEELLMGMDLAGLALSSGSACMVGSVQSSHVLEAMGIPPTIAQATLRFSLGSSIRAEDLPEIIQRARGVVLQQGQH